VYLLSDNEEHRLIQGIVAALQVPLIAGVEGYVFEALFHYVKNLPLPNPHAFRRSKTLFDCVDATKRIGWSIKAVQKSPQATAFELVVQRADVIKKRTALGFPNLSVNSSAEQLGMAVLAHWNAKISQDMQRQGVQEARVVVLLKSNNHKHYAYLEQDLVRYAPEDLIWSWTDASQTGLQAKRISDGTMVFRWYPNQKQLFESFSLPPQAFRFSLEAKRFSMAAFLERMQ
jgi:hypothetical protein